MVDLAAVAESTREVPVQVNGKVRDRIVVPAAADDAAIEAAVLASPRIQAAPRRPVARSDHPGRRGSARQPGPPGRGVSEPQARPQSWDELLGGHTPEVQAAARALEALVRSELPDAAIQFDPGNGLLAFGRR